MAGNRVRLTKDAIAGLRPEDGQWVTDTEVPQLLVRITPTAKTFVARWTSQTGKPRRQEVIAPCGSISVAEARDRARKLVTADAARAAETLADIYKVWDENHSSKGSAAHAADFRSAWKNHIEPHLGKKKLSRLTFAEVEKWYNLKLREHPTDKNGAPRDKAYSAAAVNRWVAYVSKLCTIARQHGLMVGNPVERLEKSSAERRVTIFQPDDIKALADNLTALENRYPVGVDLIRFLMIYPARGIEVRNMRWDDLDLKSGTWTIPASRYKTRRDQTFGLGPMQVEFLKNVTKRSETYVFPSPKDPTKPVRREHQRDVWAKVRPKRLGAHALRKTIGTMMINRQVPLEAISKLMGHSSVRVTEQVYAHLDPATAAKYLERFGSILEENLPEPDEIDPVLEGQVAMSISKEYDD